MKILRYFLWAAVAAAAGICLGGIALHRGEHINSLWLVLAAACSYAASTMSPLWYRIVIRMEIPAPL